MKAQNKEFKSATLKALARALLKPVKQNKKPKRKKINAQDLVVVWHVLCPKV